jgi:hypothetical protein
MVEALAKKYPEFNLKTKELPYCPVRLLSFFNK